MSESSFLRRLFPLLVTALLLAAAAYGIFSAFTRSRALTERREEVVNGAPAPVAVLDREEFDWGTIERNTIVEEIFTLANRGTAPLTINAIMTSCACTTAEILDGDAALPLPANIPPGAARSLLVRFDPSLHDARGKTKRAVRIETDDPLHPFLILSLTADVR